MALGKRTFFEAQEALGRALTYDDVRIETRPSSVQLSEVDLTTRFSKNVELKVPFVSAAMDTVSEADMAIGMAKLGGIAVIHATLDIDAQKNEVRKVKHDLNGLIERPITVREDDSLESILEMCENRRFKFRSFPVIDSDGRLAGALSGNDFRFFQHELNATASTTMTPIEELIIGSVNTSANEAYQVMRKTKKSTLPLVDSEGRVAGLYVFSDVDRIVNDNPKNFNLDNLGRLRVAAAVPTDVEALERIEAMKNYVDVVVIDTAQGDSIFAFETLKAIKENYTDIDVVVGNVSSAASARALAERGADGIKVGQGPGSICTTREELGIGTPQVTAVHESVRANKSFAGRRGWKIFTREAIKNIKSIDVPICADGGIEANGHLSIAIAIGASSIMMGSRYAGTDESPGDVLQTDEGLKKFYRGMGSESALKENLGSRKRYDAKDSGVLLPEGVESLVPYKGSLEGIVAQQKHALAKSMSQTGSRSIKEHQRKAKLWLNTQAGSAESKPHGVSVLPPQRIRKL